MKAQIILSCFIFFCFGCDSQLRQENEKEGKLVSVQLSPDDSQFVFSYFINDKGSIYTSDVNGNNVKLIAKSEGQETYSHPRFSPDGKKILFISFSQDAKSSAIFLIDNIGTNKRQLTAYVSLITEAVFSKDSESIHYCKAAETANYSPIAPESPHKMDIYSINIKTKSKKQLTNLNAYSIENLLVQDSTILFIQNLDGPYYLKLNNPEKIKTLTPKNIDEVHFIGCGGFSIKNETLYFLTGGTYQLFMMDINKREARLVLHNNFQMNNLNVFQNSNMIIFTKNISSHNEVVIFNLNNHTYKEILIVP